MLAAALALVIGAGDGHAQPRTGSSCSEPAEWLSLAGDRPTRIAGADLLREVASRDVVLLGERHDDADHHRWQLQTIAALHLLRPHMAIGFETFPRRIQPVLDRWVAGELSEKAFLDQSDWSKVWNLPPELYLPLFQFARLNRLPMVALNVERSLTQAISRGGWDAVPHAKKEGVSRPAPPPPAYLDFLFESYRQHEREGERKAAPRRDDPGFLNFVASQTTWDRAMAQALARALGDPAGKDRPLVVGIVGSGHLRYGHGVPHQLRDLGVKRIAVLLPIDAGADCKELVTGLADAVFAIARPPKEPAPRPRLGVQLQLSDGAVTLVDVVQGSLAESSGLRRGDRIVSIADSEVKDVGTVIAAVRAQPPGTWLPLRVQRGAERHDIVVKFPREP